MRGARRPASRKSARPTFPRRKGASGTCWRSSRIQETLGGRSSIETTLAVLRFRNRLVIEAWLGARLRQRRGRENGDRDGQPSAQHKNTGHCQSKFYTACSRTMAGWSPTVFARELPARSAGFNAENRLYSFALTMPTRAAAKSQRLGAPGLRSGGFRKCRCDSCERLGCD